MNSNRPSRLFAVCLLFLMFSRSLANEPKVIPFVLPSDNLASLNLLPGSEVFLEVTYRAKPDGTTLYFEEAESIWWIGEKAIVMFGSTGPVLPENVMERALCWVSVSTNGETIFEGNLYPRRDAISVGEKPMSLANKLSAVVSMDATYLAGIANYLAGNVSAVDVTATSYSVEGYGEVIDSSGTWTGNPIGSDIWTVNGSDVFLTGRNIGIGTSAPEGKFHLFQSSDPVSMIIEDAWSAANLRISAPRDHSNLIFEMGEFSSGNIKFRQEGANTNSAEIKYYANSGNLSVLNYVGDIGLHSYYGNAYIQSNRLGIGTSNPQAVTHVTKYAGVVDLLVESVDAESIVNINAGVGAYSALTFSNDSSRMAEIGYSPSDDMLYFQNDNGGSVYFLTDKFGLGTSNPSTKFHLIESNGNAIAQVESNNGDASLFLDATSGNSEVQFQIDNNYRGAFGYSATNDNLYLYHNGSVVVKDGKLGVGTQNPVGRLDVNGAIYQRGGLLHADYVFQDDYRLESILEHAEFMWREKHLPAVPAARVDETGREIVEVGQHQRGILEELEKAHIYIEQLHREIQELRELVTK